MEDYKVVIKYWDVAEISEIQKNDEYLKKRYDNYFESWNDYCANYIGNDIKVCHLIPINSEDLLTQLAQFGNLDDNDTLYASIKSTSSIIENN